MIGMIDREPRSDAGSSGGFELLSTTISSKRCFDSVCRSIESSVRAKMSPRGSFVQMTTDTSGRRFCPSDLI